MANVLDLRRRIRSVKNTRQITKAMKMVSAAKLRRAQERALSARPYAKMITSVLESLTRRADIFDPGDRRTAPSALCHAPGEAGAADRHQRRQGLCRSLQRQHSQDRLSVHRRQHRQGDRHRGGGPQGPRPDAPPLSGSGLHRADRRERPRHQDPRTQGPGRGHRRPSGNAVEAGSQPRLRAGRERHRPLRARGDRRRLHRLQRIQVGDRAAAGGGAAAAAHEDRHSADHRRRRARPKKSANAPPRPLSRRAS